MATFAGRYDEPLLKYAGGRLVPATSATVTVYESDGTTVAILYTSRTKAVTASNPVSPDGFGNLQFFADPGTYVLSVVENSTVQDTHEVAVPFDPEEVAGGVGGGATNLAWNAGTSTVTSDTGTDATLTAVDGTNPGLMTVAMKSKLDGIEAGATADQTAAEVPIADAGGYFTGTHVEAALQEVGADLGALSGTYAPIASPTFTGTVGGITKSMVGLGNVDNTSDANKPVSTAQQTALDAKAPLASPAFTGNPTAPTPAAADDDTSIATTEHVKNVAQQVYVHSGGSYSLTGGRLFIGTEDPVADGFTMTTGDEWVNPS